MATKTETASGTNPAKPIGFAFLAWIRRFGSALYGTRAAIATDEPALSADVVVPSELTFAGRIRKFLWLSSGLFSAASFAIPVVGLVAFGSFDGVGTNFLAAVVSACLFGLTTLLHFGPDVA